MHTRGAQPVHMLHRTCTRTDKRMLGHEAAAVAVCAEAAPFPAVANRRRSAHGAAAPPLLRPRAAAANRRAAADAGGHCHHSWAGSAAAPVAVAGTAQQGPAARCRHCLLLLLPLQLANCSQRSQPRNSAGAAVLAAARQHAAAAARPQAARPCVPEPTAAV